jgi:hypothetical protein
VNYLGTIIDRYSPTFAALASLREIFRVSVALCRASFFVVVVYRIRYQQRETLKLDEHEHDFHLENPAREFDLKKLESAQNRYYVPRHRRCLSQRYVERVR